MEQGTVTDKQLRALARWEKFTEAQGGVYPTAIAAIKLKMTSAGVYQAGERGWLSFFRIGRNRWYGRKDVNRYSDYKGVHGCRAAGRASAPKDCTEDEDGGAFRSLNFLE